MISQLLIAFFAYLPMLAGQEKDSGTLAAIVDFFVKSKSLVKNGGIDYQYRPGD